MAAATALGGSDSSRPLQDQGWSEVARLPPKATVKVVVRQKRRHSRRRQQQRCLRLRRFLYSPVCVSGGDVTVVTAQGHAAAAAPRLRRKKKSQALGNVMATWTHIHSLSSIDKSDTKRRLQGNLLSLSFSARALCPCPALRLPRAHTAARARLMSMNFSSTEGRAQPRKEKEEATAAECPFVRGRSATTSQTRGFPSLYIDWAFATLHKRP